MSRPVLELTQPLQNGPMSPSVCYGGRDVKLTIHFYLISTLRISGAILPLHFHVRVQTVYLPFYPLYQSIEKFSIVWEILPSFYLWRESTWTAFLTWTYC
jgi:hypothetical protein